MKKIHLLLVLFYVIFASVELKAQNYNTAGDGSWATNANWTNVSGWGGARPASGHSSGTININHNITHTGAYNEASSMNIAAGRTLTINGNFSNSGGGTVTVNGNLVISGTLNVTANFVIASGGSVTVNGAVTTSGGGTISVGGAFTAKSTVALDAPLTIQPAGVMSVDGNMSVSNSPYLNVGTNVAPPAYADFILRGNLSLLASGDATFNRNARVGIFGSVTSTGGGVLFTVNDGAQAYVHGNMNLSSGTGNMITNNNASSPVGFYSNGTILNTGGGSSTTTNVANKAYMEANNIPFTNWLNLIPSTPLPITLAVFAGKNLANGKIEITWTTLSELNNKLFTLLRSRDGQNWEEVAEIAGAGNATRRLEYRYLDEQPSAICYYRLKQTDFDGHYTFSKMITVGGVKTQTVRCYPNPTPEKLYVEYNGDEAEIFIYNVQGVECFHEYIQGSTSLEINTMQWPKGVYFVKFSNDATSFQRIVKN